MRKTPDQTIHSLHDIYIYTCQQLLTIVCLYYHHMLSFVIRQNCKGICVKTKSLLYSGHVLIDYQQGCTITQYDIHHNVICLSLCNHHKSSWFSMMNLLDVRNKKCVQVVKYFVQENNYQTDSLASVSMTNIISENTTLTRWFMH